MCGIVGYNGKNNSLPVLIEGLKQLEYRGYDSAGVAYIKKDGVKIVKSKGKITNLEEKLPEDVSGMGIGHTRWATHGVPNETNSHPHRVGNVTIVHNGIIENFKELKAELEGKGYEFKSQTDTEVACALIDSFYQESKDIVASLNNFMKTAKGAYAIGAMFDGDENIYSVRKDCPLIVAKGEEENLIASDLLAVNKYAKEVLYLEPGIVAKVGTSEIKLYDNEKEIEAEFKEVPKMVGDTGKCGYDHYMLKEIHEQPRVFKDTTDRFVGDDGLITDNMPDFSCYDQIDVVACGSAYHTGLVGKNLIEEYAEVPVNVDIASEYRYKKNFYRGKSLVIVVSQSGETADTLAALRKAKDEGVDTLAIVNAPNSSIARESKYVITVQAGPEIAVATTKAYSAQVAIFSLIALNMGLSKGNISKDELSDILKEIKSLPVQIENLINNCNYKEVANTIYERDDIFFIGRGIDYSLCLEGSLKLKEISYIHSQAYAAGELKHGTISLVEDGTPVIGIITDEYLKDKTISNIEEVKSRGAKIVVVTNDNSIVNYDYVMELPKVNKLLQPLLTIIPLQLISYEVAKLRECDIDKPKNLAKSVTVE